MYLKKMHYFVLSFNTMKKRQEEKFDKYHEMSEDQTLRRWKALPKLNRIYLVSFLIIIVVVFLMLFIAELFNDLGWWNGHFHINYYYNPAAKGNHPAYLDPYYDTPRDEWGFYGLSVNDQLWSKWNIRLIRQPNLFWAFTQFTWLTTFSVFLILFVRLFKYQEQWPDKIKWMISHAALYMITVLDTVVMVVFWSALSRNFDNAFSIDPVLMILRKTVTILVHALLPSLLLIYTSIFGILDRDASVLKKRKFITVGTIIIMFYVVYYILMSFTWDDPYAPLTHLRQGEMGGWWKLLALALAMELVMWGSYYWNNFVITKWNKFYKAHMLREEITKRVIKKKKKKERDILIYKAINQLKRKKNKNKK